VIVTDTVGFIRDLPPDLVAGFRATLEEIEEAHVILHVADVSSAVVDSHVASVRETLADLGLAAKPECLILNKCDRLEPAEVARLARRLGGIPISAQTGAGVAEMLEAVESLVFSSSESREGDPLALGAGGPPT